jgi:uncharacterized protein YsxB (DUF464 family)
MIRASVVESHGVWLLRIAGHADPSVCAAVTAVEQSMAIWLEQLAELQPEHITFTYSQETSPS